MLLPIRIETEVERFPAFTYLIIGANAIVFLSMRFLPASILEMAYHDYGFIPERLDAFTLLTSMFVHGGWLHIIGNMYFLWLFGRAVEQRLDRVLYSLLYFSSGIAGAFLQAALTPDYLADIPCIGASGAISGILGAYMIMYPWEEVSCIYFSFTMRYATSISLSTIWVLGSWFIFQFVDAVWFSPKTAEATVAFWAHIGGFAFGVLAAAVPAGSTALANVLRRRSLTVALEEYADLFRKGKIEEAEAKLKSAWKASPANPLVLGELGRLELGRKNMSAARKLLRRSLKRAIKQKEDARAVGAFVALAAAGEKPPDNSQRLVIARRFIRLKKYGHALGIMGSAFTPDAETRGLDLLLYEIAELFAGPLNDKTRAAAAYSLLQQLFPHSLRSLDAEYQIRKLRAKGDAWIGD